MKTNNGYGETQIGEKILKLLVKIPIVAEIKKGDSIIIPMTFDVNGLLETTKELLVSSIKNDRGDVEFLLEEYFKIRLNKELGLKTFPIMKDTDKKGLTDKEKMILADDDFKRRLENYSHSNIEERITEAWLDTNKSNFTEDEDYSKAFVIKCEKIIKESETK